MKAIKIYNTTNKKELVYNFVFENTDYKLLTSSFRLQAKNFNQQYLIEVEENGLVLESKIIK